MSCRSHDPCPVRAFSHFLFSDAKPNANGRSDKRMSIIWSGWMCDEPLVIRVVLVSCCAAYVWCSIISAQGAENGCQDCVIEFGFQLFWSGLRRGVAISVFDCIEKLVGFRFVFPYFSSPDVLVAGPGISASDPYLFREGRQ